MFVKATVGLTLGQLVAAALPTTGTATVPGAGTALRRSRPRVHHHEHQQRGHRLRSTATWTTGSSCKRRVRRSRSFAGSRPTRPRRPRSTRSPSPTHAAEQPDRRRRVRHARHERRRAAASSVRTTSSSTRATTVPWASPSARSRRGTTRSFRWRASPSFPSVGNGIALVVNQPAVGSAAGVIKGSAAAAANLYTGAGLILPQIANAGGPALHAVLRQLHGPVRRWPMQFIHKKIDYTTPSGQRAARDVQAGHAGTSGRPTST